MAETPKVSPLLLSMFGRYCEGYLARQFNAALLPLALEYPFWEEKNPEALARFGEEITSGDVDLAAADWLPILEDCLGVTLDALATEACCRDLARFEALLDSGAGVGGVSDAWRHLKARFRSGKLPSVPGEEEPLPREEED